MNIQKTSISGVYTIDIHPHVDERGFYARTWDKTEFAKIDLETSLVQCSLSYNHTRGTLRGMHYQDIPYAEHRLIRCVKGKIYDVVLDLRPHSRTYLKHIAHELSDENRKAVFIPPGVAHGYLTLQDNTEIFYQMSQVYNPHLARGVRYNDPAFGIQWPEEIRVISERDAAYPDYETSQ